MNNASSNRRYEVLLVVLLTLAGGIAAVDAQAVFYVMPFIVNDLHLSNTQVGLIGSAVLLGWSLAAFGLALMSDHLGRRKPFLVGAFVCFALFSGLSAVVTSFVGLLVARLAMGIAEGPVIPIQHTLLMAESPPQRRGLNMGLVQNFGAQLIGSLAAPVLLVWLASKAGWRSAFLVAGLPALILALLMWRWIREPLPASVVDARQVGSTRSRLAAVWRERNIKVCVLLGTCCVAWYFMLLTFVPLWLTTELHLSAGTMSGIVAMMGAAGATGAIVVAGLSDRIGRRAAIRLFSSVGLVAPLGILFSGPRPILLGLSMFIGCLMVGTFSLFMGTVPQESVPPEHRATATAMVLCIAQLAGGIAGPAIGGVLADRFGLQAPLILAVVLAIAAVALSTGLREPER
jgi:ACS family hexuronate transporter-like MFS transporter